MVWVVRFEDALAQILALRFVGIEQIGGSECAGIDGSLKLRLL